MSSDARGPVTELTLQPPECSLSNSNSANHTEKVFPEPLGLHRSSLGGWESVKDQICFRTRGQADLRGMEADTNAWRHGIGVQFSAVCDGWLNSSLRSGAYSIAAGHPQRIPGTRFRIQPGIASGGVVARYMLADIPGRRVHVRRWQLSLRRRFCPPKTRYTTKEEGALRLVVCTKNATIVMNIPDNSFD